MDTGIESLHGFGDIRRIDRRGHDRWTLVSNLYTDSVIFAASTDAVMIDGHIGVLRWCWEGLPAASTDAVMIDGHGLRCHTRGCRCAASTDAVMIDGHDDSLDDLVRRRAAASTDAVMAEFIRTAEPL